MVRSSGVAYYVRDLVPGRAEGTGVVGESPGEWTGGGSSVLGVRGVVRTDEFVELMAGRDPQADRSLRSALGPRPVAGVDLLFCAPKSVSLLHLLGPRELADATGAAHRAAVTDAVGYLEREGLGVRRTRGGVTRHLPATGVVAAGFVHRTSRALDPHVHTHLVTANVAQGVDGVWSAVDTRRLFVHRRALAAAYDASLRRQLTDRLGVAWERGPTGRWDVAGVDPVLARLFSQRTASIDEQVSRGGGHPSPGRRRVAFHAERPDKDSGPTVEGLRAEWRRRACDHDLDPADLVRVVGRARVASARSTVDRDDLAAKLDELSARRRTLDARDLLVAVAESSPSGLGVGDLESATAAVVRNVAPLVGGTSSLHGRDPADRGGRRWAATDLVRALDASPGPLDAVAGRPVVLQCQPSPWRDRASGPERPDHTAARAPGFGPPTPGHHR